MKRPVFAVLILVLAVGALPGCGEDECTTCPPPPLGYVPSDSPSAVLVNLIRAHERRNIEEYAKLLAPEFRFYFQPGDAMALGMEFWTRSQDASGTEALLASPLVSDILAALDFGEAVIPDEKKFPPGIMMIRADPVIFQVDQTDGITWLVLDAQEFFFRAGNASNGEDPDIWFLVEWRDILSVVSPQPESVESVTWGGLKAKYQKP